MVTRPSISVTIAQWGKTGFTERCVDALRASAYGGEIEVLVRDNASAGGPGGIADRADVRLVRGDENIGFGPAHDQLAQMAGGALLLILNNDTIVAPDAIDRLVDALEADPGIGAVGPRYVDFGGTTLEMGGFVGGGGTAGQFLRGAVPPPTFMGRPFEVDYSSAACLLVRRPTFLEMGGFDDVYAPAYYEDTDLCMRLREAGLRTVVEPRAVVHHYEGGTAGRDTSTGLKRLQVEHQNVFADRWADRLAGLPAMTPEVALTRALGLAPDRPSVLWLTPELPRPDREAGSARLVAMLSTLADAGARPVLWAESASEFERYGPTLDAAGVPWFFGTSRLRRRPGGDPLGRDLEGLVRLHPWRTIVVSFPEMADRYVSSLRGWAPNVPIVVDAVDLHFLRESRAVAPDTEAAATKAWELGVYRQVDAVITASRDEVTILADEAPDIPARSFESVPTLEVAERSLGDPTGPLVFLGNMNHPPNLDAVAYWAEEIHPLLGSRAPLVVYGTGSERIEGKWPEAVRVGGWVPDLLDAFRGASVFVAPLRYGAGTKGKVLEAAAAGVPIVTTPIGAEGFDGPLAAAMLSTGDPHEIASAIEQVRSSQWFERASLTLDAMRSWTGESMVRQAEWASWLGRRRVLG